MDCYSAENKFSFGALPVIIVHPKASWDGLICHTHQHYHSQWLPNTKWSKSRRSAWARDRWLWS